MDPGHLPQNEVRKIKPGQEAEVAFKMYPGRIVKCKVDSIMWATAQGQLPIGTMNPAGGVAPVPPESPRRPVADGRQGQGHFPGGGRHGRRCGLHRQRSCHPHSSQGHRPHRRKIGLADSQTALRRKQRMDMNGHQSQRDDEAVALGYESSSCPGSTGAGRW